MNSVGEYVMNFPIKETLITLLLLILTVSVNNIALKPTFIKIINSHESIRLFIVFLISYMFLGLGGEKIIGVRSNKYSEVNKIVSSIIVAILFEYFLSSDAGKM